MAKSNPSKQVDISKSKLLYDYVLLKPVIIEEVAGMILRPHQYEDKPEFGEVVSMGPGKYTDNGELIKPQFKVGDVVLFQKYSTEKIRNPADGKDYLILKQEDIRCVL